MSLATGYSNNGTVQTSVMPWGGPSRMVPECIFGNDSGYVIDMQDEGSCIEVKNNPSGVGGLTWVAET